MAATPVAAMVESSAEFNLVPLQCIRLQITSLGLDGYKSQWVFMLIKDSEDVYSDGSMFHTQSLRILRMCLLFLKKHFYQKSPINNQGAKFEKNINWFHQLSRISCIGLLDDLVKEDLKIYDATEIKIWCGCGREKSQIVNLHFAHHARLNLPKNCSRKNLLASRASNSKDSR